MYDSNFNPEKEEPLGHALEDQLEELYGWLYNEAEQLLIQFPSVQSQTAGIDCGLFAIANAVELLLDRNTNFSTMNFDQDRMRQHMFDCLLSCQLLPFPKLEPVAQRQRNFGFMISRTQNKM